MKSGYTIKNENVTVDYCFGEECTGAICGDHCHDKYEITYLISNDGRYIVEGSEHKLTRGSIILLTPTSYHNVSINSGSNTELYSIYFNRCALSLAVSSLLDKLCLGAEGRGVVYNTKLISEPLRDCFERFSLCQRLNDAERDAFISAILSEIVILLSAAEGERMKECEDELGARVARYVNANIYKNLSLEKLARRFFVSKYYLCRAFKNYSGISLHAYINQKRIIFAKQLIESGITASEAAERVGFGDYSAFYRAYVKTVGRSPTAPDTK